MNFVLFLPTSQQRPRLSLTARLRTSVIDNVIWVISKIWTQKRWWDSDGTFLFVVALCFDKSSGSRFESADAFGKDLNTRFRCRVRNITLMLCYIQAEISNILGKDASFGQSHGVQERFPKGDRWWMMCVCRLPANFMTLPLTVHCSNADLATRLVEFRSIGNEHLTRLTSWRSGFLFWIFKTLTFICISLLGLLTWKRVPAITPNSISTIFANCLSSSGETFLLRKWRKLRKTRSKILMRTEL